MNTHDTDGDRIYAHTPAQTWEYAMLSGNGTQGALVFGEPADETVIVTHERLFRPRRYPGDPLAVAPYLGTLRTIISREGYAAGLVFLDTLAGEKEMRVAEGSPSFHPAFTLSIQTALQGAVHGYVRETDFRSGEVAVRFQDETAAYSRRLFVSRADGDIVMELRCDRAAGMSCDLHLLAPEHPDVATSCGTTPDGTWLRTAYRHGAAGYDGAVRLVVTDGAVTAVGDRLHVKNAQNVLLRLRVAPWTSAVESTAPALLQHLGTKSACYRDSLQAHRAIHGAWYGRVSLDLGGSETDRRRDIESLLQTAQQAGTASPALIEKLYRAGRYMSLCCFGQLPPNLQGVWTGTWDCPWASTYVWDTNYQLAIASVMSSNLAELQQAHFNLIELVLPFWRDNARRIGGCRGVFASGAFAAGINPDGAEKHTYGQWSWMFGAGYAGWMARIAYEHWLHTGDEQTLKRHTLPLLVELAQFYEDWLVPDADGRLRFTPACSPELAFADNPTFEIAVARDVFAMLNDCAHALDASARKALGVTPEALARWADLVARLPDYLVNTASTSAGPVDSRPYFIDKVQMPLAADGALKEFAVPNVPEGYAHRHYSHLYPLFVSSAFDPKKTPELWQAAEIAFLQRMKYPLNATHARMHAALCAASLGRGNMAWERIASLAVDGLVFPNLMISHVAEKLIFNVDGNGALPEIVHRLLIQAQPGRIILLPALPTALRTGCIRGIRIVRQITVAELRWDVVAGTLRLALVSAIDQTVTLVLGGGRTWTTGVIDNAEIHTELSRTDETALSLPLTSGQTCLVDICIEHAEERT